MRYPLLAIAAAVVLASCGGGAAPSTTSTTTSTLPPPTTLQGCDNVSYIMPTSTDATITMSRVYTFLKTEKPDITGTEFQATLLQIGRIGAYDLITIRFDNDLGTMLFVQEPGYTVHIGWEGPTQDQAQIRDSLKAQFPDLPAQLIDCQDLSYFTS